MTGYAAILDIAREIIKDHKDASHYRFLQQTIYGKGIEVLTEIKKNNVVEIIIKKDGEEVIRL